MSIFENFGENKGQKPAQDVMTFGECIMDAFNQIKTSYALDRATAVQLSANSFCRRDDAMDNAYADI